MFILNTLQDNSSWILKHYFNERWEWAYINVLHAVGIYRRELILSSSVAAREEKDRKHIGVLSCEMSVEYWYFNHIWVSVLSVMDEWQERLSSPMACLLLLGTQLSCSIWEGFPGYFWAWSCSVLRMAGCRAALHNTQLLLLQKGSWILACAWSGLW